MTPRDLAPVDSAPPDVGRPRVRRRAALATAALAAALLVPGANAAGGRDAPAEEYVPFVTDFPRAEQAQQPYVPFVTDFPRPATPAAAATGDDSIVGPVDRQLVALGGLAAALGALLAAAWAGRQRHVRPARL